MQVPAIAIGSSRLSSRVAVVVLQLQDGRRGGSYPDSQQCRNGGSTLLMDGVHQPVVSLAEPWLEDLDDLLAGRPKTLH